MPASSSPSSPSSFDPIHLEHDVDIKSHRDQIENAGLDRSDLEGIYTPRTLDKLFPAKSKTTKGKKLANKSKKSKSKGKKLANKSQKSMAKSPKNYRKAKKASASPSPMSPSEMVEKQMMDKSEAYR